MIGVMERSRRVCDLVERLGIKPGEVKGFSLYRDCIPDVFLTVAAFSRLAVQMGIEAGDIGLNNSGRAAHACFVSTREKVKFSCCALHGTEVAQLVRLGPARINSSHSNAAGNLPAPALTHHTP